MDQDGEKSQVLFVCNVWKGRERSIDVYRYMRSWRLVEGNRVRYFFTPIGLLRGIVEMMAELEISERTIGGIKELVDLFLESHERVIEAEKRLAEMVKAAGKK